MRLDEIKLRLVQSGIEGKYTFELEIFFANRWHTKAKRFFSRFDLHTTPGAMARKLRTLADQIQDR